MLETARITAHGTLVPNTILGVHVGLELFHCFSIPSVIVPKVFWFWFVSVHSQADPADPMAAVVDTVLLETDRTHVRWTMRLHIQCRWQATTPRLDGATHARASVAIEHPLWGDHLAHDEIGTVVRHTVAAPVGALTVVGVVVMGALTEAMSTPVAAGCWIHSSRDATVGTVGLTAPFLCLGQNMLLFCVCAWLGHTDSDRRATSTSLHRSSGKTTLA